MKRWFGHKQLLTSDKRARDNLGKLHFENKSNKNNEANLNPSNVHTYVNYQIYYIFVTKLNVHFFLKYLYFVGDRGTVKSNKNYFNIQYFKNYYFTEN